MEPWEAAAQTPKAALEPWEAAAQQPGIGTRLLGDLQNRMAAGNEIVNDPNRSALVKVPQYVGKVGAGLANDAIGEVIKSGVNSLPQGVKDAGSAALSAAESIVPDSYNRAVNNSIEGGKRIYNNQSQETKDSLDSAANVVGLGANLAGAVGAAGKVADVAGAARKGINALSDAAQPIDWAKYTKGPLPTSKNLFSEGDKAYEVAGSAGAGARPVATNGFIDQAFKNAQQNPDLLLKDGPDAVQNYLEGLNVWRDRPIPLATAQASDIQLRELAQKAFRAGDNDLGTRYKAIRQALRDKIYNAPDPTHITGGPQGFYALKEGNRLYAQGYQVEDLENALAKGMENEVQSTGIKTQFRKLADDIRENGPAGKTPELVDAINTAARTGALTGILKTLGSKLGPVAASVVGGTLGAGAGPIGAAIGSVGAGAASYLATAPFRAAATAIQEGKAANAIRAAVTDAKFHPMEVPPEAPKPMLALPAPDAQYAVGADGVARRLTAEEAQAGQAARQNLDNMGLTSDVRSNINRLQLREKFGPAWDKITAAQQDTIAKQIEDAWRSNPKTQIADLVDSARKSAQDLAEAKGQPHSDTALGTALLNALKKGKK